jgi:uncharacterized phage protein (TIGR01671 family)
MREIKFRQPIFSNGKFNYYHHWGFINDVFVGPDRGDIERLSEQFTGLFDKNNEGIYEGDILDVVNPNGDKDRQCIVKWDTNGDTYSYSPYDGYGEFDVTSIGWAMQLEFIFKIIGNIYQNPELIK